VPCRKPPPAEPRRLSPVRRHTPPISRIPLTSPLPPHHSLGEPPRAA
jgi:hypothetical protein